MAKTLEQILKAKGYSDADLAGMSTVLSDPKFRGALEEEFGVLETKASKLEADVSAWSEWHQNKAIPELEKAMKGEQDARAEAASHAARLKALSDQGLLKMEEQKETPKETPVDTFDPKKYGLVTREDVAQLANLEGDAIMLAQDIAAEHQALGLGPLKFRDLRRAAMEAKVPVDKYWEQTYKVQEKRQELETKRAADAEAKIRADERAKVASEYANPQTRPGIVSRAPFLPQPKAGETKQPWDDANQARNNRIDKAFRSALEKVN